MSVTSYENIRRLNPEMLNAYKATARRVRRAYGVLQAFFILAA
jgi:ribosomal protein L34E